MSSSSRILAAATALTLAATVAAPAMAADAPAPQLTKKSPILFVDNQINPGVIAVAFRTDKPLDRKSNGKSIDGSAGVKGHRYSLSTFVKAGKPAYIAYIGGVSVGGRGEHLTVGHRYQVTISIGGQTVTRTVKLQANTKESKVKRQLGYY
jgi:opacity protein-like surface antigen